MKSHVITSKVTLTLPSAYGSVADKEADFDQISLRVRKGARYVNVRVVSLGDKIALELFEGYRKVREITIGNDSVNARVLDKDIVDFLG